MADFWGHVLIADILPAFRPDAESAWEGEAVIGNEDESPDGIVEFLKPVDTVGIPNEAGANYGILSLSSRLTGVRSDRPRAWNNARSKPRISGPIVGQAAIRSDRSGGRLASSS